MSILARETKHVENMNERLEQEDAQLAGLAKQAEVELIAKHRKQALQAEKVKEARLKQENAALVLANQKMKERMLVTRQAYEKAEISSMQQKLKSGQSPLMALHFAQQEVAHAKKKAPFQQMVGKYVHVCQKGKGCHVAYVHESQRDWEAANHTHAVTQNGIGYPLGPVVRKPVNDFTPPLRDVMPGKSVKLGDNKLSFGEHDHYVKWEHTGLNPASLLPPWRKNETEGEEADGLEEMKGFNGTREIYEALPFSGSKMHDWRQEHLERAGVNVDSWGEENTGKLHKWDGAGVDHWPEGPPEPEDVKWEELERPQWAWDNHAMKSQGWEPEGKLNKDLMLGVGWNDTGNAFDDNFAGRKEYATQIEHEHGFLMQHEDHFADWKPNSTKNLRLLYGDAELARSRVWHPKEGVYSRDEWGLGDAQVTAKQAAKQLHIRSTLQRTGEPFTDTLTGRGWSGADMVATTANNFKGTAVEDESSEATPPTKLERLGVKV